MKEVWLGQNNRAIWFGMTIPMLLSACMGLLLSGLVTPFEADAVRVIAWVLLALGIVLTLVLLAQMAQPRLAYVPGFLLVNLRAGKPVAVPIDVVEAFLLGQGPAMLTNRRDDRREARVLTIRLAERAEEWANIEVKSALGKWCGGYIAIRGTWCEPLNLDLVNRLNHRLAEVKQEAKA
jgi:hypothetical protein